MKYVVLTKAFDNANVAGFTLGLLGLKLSSWAGN
jgi:hypothetical protein